jgi:hypothetical protein
LRRIDELVARRAKLETEIAQVFAFATGLRLYLASAEVSPANVARLREALKGERRTGGGEDSVSLSDDGEPGPRIGHIGRLTALLRAVGSCALPTQKRENARALLPRRF